MKFQALPKIPADHQHCHRRHDDTWYHYLFKSDLYPYRHVRHLRLALCDVSASAYHHLHRPQHIFNTHLTYRHHRHITSARQPTIQGPQPRYRRNRPR